MQNTLVRRWGVILVTTCMLSASILQPAFAGVISTETAIELEARQTQIDHINDILAQEDLRAMLVRLGVDPEHASARVEALTNEELQALQQNLDELPVGGVGFVEVVGIVAIGAAVFIASLIIFAVIKATMGLRVSEEEELRGLDLAEHDMEAYAGFQIFTTQ